MTENKIKLFESQQIRTEWDAEAEKWWFSILDVVAVLTDQPDYKKVRNYWKWLKNKLIAEGSQLGSDTNQLKMEATDSETVTICHGLSFPHRLWGSQPGSMTNQLGWKS